MKIHIVQKGETLEQIATRYNVDLMELKEMNSQIENQERLLPGMKVRIPTKSSTVKKEVPIRNDAEQNEDEKREQALPKETPSAEQTFKPFTPPIFPGGQDFPKPPPQPDQDEGFMHHPFKPLLPKEGLPELGSKTSGFQQSTGKKEDLHAHDEKLSLSQQQSYDPSPYGGIPPYQMPAMPPNHSHHPYQPFPYYSPYPAYSGAEMSMQYYPMAIQQSHPWVYQGPGAPNRSFQHANDFQTGFNKTGDGTGEDSKTNVPLTPVQGIDDTSGRNQTMSDHSLYPYGAPEMSGPSYMPDQQGQMLPMGMAMPGYAGMMPMFNTGQTGGEQAGVNSADYGYGMMPQMGNGFNPWMMPPQGGFVPQQFSQPVSTGMYPFQPQMGQMNMQLGKYCGCGAKQMMHPQSYFPVYPLPNPIYSMNHPGNVMGGWPMPMNPLPDQVRFDDEQHQSSGESDEPFPFGDFPVPSDLNDDDNPDDSF